MADKIKIALLHMDIYKEPDGTFTADLTPEIIPTDKYDYVKVALVSAEVKNYLAEQLHVINMDEDGKINKLADLFVGDIPDEDLKGKQVQTKLDFKEGTS